MSQQKAITDAERSEEINKFFDLKVDKDILARPTKDVVCEIYRRFLDQVKPNWKQPVNPHYEWTELSVMTYWMRVITKEFNTGFEFSRMDLAAPTRKRTAAFINVILYVRALYDTVFERYQQFEAKCADSQKEADWINEEISRLRTKEEEFAYLVGSVNRVELADEVKRLSEVLEAAKRKCDEKTERKTVIKKQIAENEEEAKRLQIENEKIEKDIAEFNRRQELGPQIEKVRQELKHVEAALLDRRVKSAKHEAETLKIQEEIDKKAQLLNQELTDMVQKGKDKRREADEGRAKIYEDCRMTDECIREAEKAVDDLRNRVTNAKAKSGAEIRAIFQDYKANLNNLFGVHDESALGDGPNNRTFVRSSSVAPAAPRGQS